MKNKPETLKRHVGWGGSLILALQEAEAEDWLPGLRSEFKVSLGNLVRPCLKIKSKKESEDIPQW